MCHSIIIVFLTVGEYFASLSSVLIVHNVTLKSTPLQLEYLDALQVALNNLTDPLKLQWINVAKIPDNDTLEWQILRTVNSSVTEVSVHFNFNCNFHLIPIALMEFLLIFSWQGFITVLPQTQNFLHARYFATRNANVRLKDKMYLFLCEHENPKDLLSMELLQCKYYNYK